MARKKIIDPGKRRDCPPDARATTAVDVRPPRPGSHYLNSLASTARSGHWLFAVVPCWCSRGGWPSRAQFTSPSRTFGIWRLFLHSRLRHAPRRGLPPITTSRRKYDASVDRTDGGPSVRQVTVAAGARSSLVMLGLIGCWCCCSFQRSWCAGRAAVVALIAVIPSPALQYWPQLMLGRH